MRPELGPETRSAPAQGHGAGDRARRRARRLTRCHLRRSPAERDLRVPGPARRSGTPTTGGLWFQSDHLRDRPLPAKSAVGPLRRDRVVRGISPPRSGYRCSNDSVDSRWSPSSGVLEQADEQLARAGSHRRPRLADRLRRARPDPHRRPALRRARAARRSAGARARPPGCSRWPATSPARAARCWCFSYEHDLQTLLIRLVALEAGQLGGLERTAASTGSGRPSRRPTAAAAQPRRAAAPTPRAASRPSRSSRSTPTGCSCTAPPARSTALDDDHSRRSPRCGEATGDVAAGRRRLPAEDARARRTPTRTSGSPR